ncbi:MAG: GldG family protein [Bdellovibrionales bacterium]|nr:GldG family protein [Bdellovibrionales bacterium]
MSRLGKILFFIAGISLAILLAVRYVLGGWINPLFIPLIIGGVSLIGAIIIDFKLYLEFMTMRTTKHGMNMGTMILLVLALLVSINFLAVKKNKVWDLTEDKLFSLSPQSVDILKPLKTSVRFVIFYRGEKSRENLNSLRETLRLYQDLTNQVEVVFYDSYLENIKAQEYLNSLPDKDAAQNKVFAFVEYEGKRERFNAPFGETEITSALVKVTRKTTNKVYFLTGHGERDLSSEGEEGLRGLKDLMEQYSTKVESFNLLQNPTLPAEASAIIIAGPKQPLMENEIQLLFDFAYKGGKLLILADPGEKHNLAILLNKLGVEFSNTFILNGGLQVSGVSQVTVVGLQFDQNSKITKPFLNGNTFALFHLASEVRAASGHSDLKVAELVKTSDRSMSITELSPKVRPGNMKSYILGVSVQGKLKDREGKQSDKDFSLIAYGDSDFVTNKFLSLPTNENLILNSLADLTGETDLISIRPKQPKQTKLVMTNGSWLGVVSAGVLLPTLLIIFGSVIWFRRRSA